MRSQTASSSALWKGQLQQREDDLVRELLEADDVDNVLARLEKDHYKRMFPALRTLTSFDSGATTLEAPSSNSEATAATMPPAQKVPAATASPSPIAVRVPGPYGATGRYPPPPPPPPPPASSAAEEQDVGVSAAAYPADVTSPLTIPSGWMPSWQPTQHAAPRVNSAAAAAPANMPPPPPPPLPSPLYAKAAHQPPTLNGLYSGAGDRGNRDHRAGSPVPTNPDAIHGIASRLNLSDPNVLTPDDDGALGLRLGESQEDSFRNGGAGATNALVPRFSTQTRVPAALGLYGPESEGLEDPAQGRIARQLQLLRNYRELADLCAKTSDPSSNLFGAITPEALARQQADQISARAGSPVTVNNNYFFTSPGDSASRAASPGGRSLHCNAAPAGGKSRGAHTPSHSRSRRTSLGLSEEHVDPSVYGSTRVRSPPPPPPPPRRSSSAQPSVVDNTPASIAIPLAASQRKPPPPPPPPFTSTGNVSLPDSPMALPMSTGHRPSQSAATIGGGTTNTHNSPSRSQRSRSHRLQGMRDVTSTATTEEAGSFDDEDEEGEEDYGADFLDGGDDGDFVEDYPYSSEDPALAPRIIEREQHRRPQRDGIPGATNYSNVGTGGVRGNSSGVVGGGGGGSSGHRAVDADGEPLPQDPFTAQSTNATTTDGMNTIIDRGSFASGRRGSGSADKAGGGASPESARSLSRINVISGQGALEAEAPASHTRRTSGVPSVGAAAAGGGGAGGAGGRPRPSDDLDTEDAERGVDLHADALSGSPVDMTQPMHGSRPGRGSSRRTSRTSAGAGVTPEKQNQRRGGDHSGDEDDTPGNPQLQTRNPNGSRRRRGGGGDRRTHVPANRRHDYGYGADAYGNDDDYNDNGDDRRGRHHRRSRRSRPRYPHQSNPSWYSDGEGSYSYSSDYSPYSSDVSFDEFDDRRRRARRDQDGYPQRPGAAGRPGSALAGSTPQERSGTRPRPGAASGSPANNSSSNNNSGARRNSLSTGPLGSAAGRGRGRGRGAAGTGAGGSGAGPSSGAGRGAGRGRGRGQSLSPPRLSPNDVAAPGRGTGTRGRGGAAAGRGGGAVRGRGRGRGASASPVRRQLQLPDGRIVSSPGGGGGGGPRSTASTPVWKQVGSTASTAVNSPRPQPTPDAGGRGAGPQQPGQRPPLRPGAPGSQQMPGQRARSPSNVRVQPGLLYGSLLPTASPRTAFVVDDPYSLVNNQGVSMEELMLQRQQLQQQMVATRYGTAPSALGMGGYYPSAPPSIPYGNNNNMMMMMPDPVRPAPTPQSVSRPTGNTVSPDRPGNMAVVGNHGDVQPLVWKSGNSATIMGRNWHIPSAPHGSADFAAPPRPAIGGSPAGVVGGGGNGILMNTSQNTTTAAGGGGYSGQGGNSPVPRPPPLQQQQLQQPANATPSVTIQVPTNYQMPGSAPLAPAADRRRMSYGAASSLALGASAVTPQANANAANSPTPAQRFGIVSLST